MQNFDLHVHTVYSDGTNTPEEMVCAAIARGMETIGFSDHSYTDFDGRYCMKKERIAAYRAEIASLREKYRGRIRVLCGIEQDYYSDAPTDGYDYVIGGVHSLKFGDRYFDVDGSVEALREAARCFCGGDIYAVVEEYYRTVANLVPKTHATIIGHFDLIDKQNERTPFFDETHPRCRRAWQAAADSLLACGIPFEINTGAISRGYKTVPYPAPEMREYIRSRGGTFLAASDSHRAETLCFGFETL